MTDNKNRTEQLSQLGTEHQDQESSPSPTSHETQVVGPDGCHFKSSQHSTMAQSDV
jgi:hypothetical protein